MNSPKKITGIGGLPRSGKDTVAELIMDAGYFGVSLGDIVRDESKIRHADKPDPISVANMTETSNWFRAQKGPDFAMKEALNRFDSAAKEKVYKGLVVYSVRAPVEVDFILEKQGYVIWVEADDEVRLQRNNDNLRSGETPLSLDDMKAQESLQSEPQPGLPTEIQMNTRYVKEHANIFIKNNGDDIEEFTKEAKQTLRENNIISA